MVIWILVAVGAVVIAALAALLAISLDLPFLATILPAAVAVALVFWGVRRLTATGRVTR